MVHDATPFLLNIYTSYYLTLISQVQLHLLITTTSLLNNPEIALDLMELNINPYSTYMWYTVIHMHLQIKILLLTVVPMVACVVPMSILLRKLDDQCIFRV